MRIAVVAPSSRLSPGGRRTGAPDRGGDPDPRAADHLPSAVLRVMGPLRRRRCDAGRRADRGRQERRLRRGLVRARRLRRRAPAGAGLPALGPAARRKTWLGYSDAGALLAAPSTRPASGAWRTARSPRTCCATAARRPCGARWRGSATRDPSTLEPGLAADPRPAAAFNLSILSTLIGHALAAGPRRPRADGRGRRRIHVPDRPALLPRDQQPRHPPRRGLTPRPLQRDPRQRHRLSA